MKQPGRGIDWAEIRRQKANGSFYLDNTGRELSPELCQEKIKAIFGLLFSFGHIRLKPSEKPKDFANLGYLGPLQGEQERRNSVACSLMRIRKSLYGKGGIR